MRLSVVATCLAFCLIGFSSAQDAQASIRKETNIPAEGLGPALNTLAKERNFQIVYVTEEIETVRTEGAVGVFTTEEALKRLLSGTGLTYRYLDDRTVTIGSATAPHERTGRASKSTSTGSSNDEDSKQEGKRGTSGTFRLAQVDQGKSPIASSVGNTAPNSQEIATTGSTGLSEIVVTAQKKNENQQNVPVPVSVLSADALVDSNQIRLQDYATSVPSLGFTPDGFGGGTLTIRGVNPGGSNPTVGVVIDDVPFGASTAAAGGGGSGYLPDLDPSDIQQIEVLRGPQGTLYGASTMGGLVKFVTVDPSTDGVTGRIQADVNGVSHGGEAGYGARGALNLPVNDTLALRVSAFARRDPGYVDDVQSGQKDVNWGTTSGMRLAALWKPSEDFSFKLSGLYQNSTVHGFPFVNLGPGYGDLQQSTLRDTGWVHNSIQAYSFIAKAKVPGGGELTFLSGYNNNKILDSIDFTPILGAFTEFGVPGSGFNGFGTSNTPFLANLETKKFSEELRLTMPLGNRVDWLVGAFYTRDSTNNLQSLYAGPSGRDFTGFVGNFHFDIVYNEYAAFTDVTLRFTDEFDVQFGARESRNTQSYDETDRGPYASVFELADPYIYPHVPTRASDFTYLVTPRYRFSPNLMAYARLASGYRPGGPNPAASVLGVDQTFSADTTKNYEIGVKGNAWENSLTFDVSLFYIDWNNIQLSLIDPANDLGYNGNGGRARSDGVEISLEAKPTRGLTLSLWGVYDDAVLTESFPANTYAYGVKGDRLPYASKLSGSASVQQEFPLVRGWKAFVGATESYVGNRIGLFVAPTSVVPLVIQDRQNYPGYAKTDIRAGITGNDWSVSLFGNNVTDKRAIEAGGIGYSVPNFYGVIPPRTFGVSVSRSFR